MTSFFDKLKKGMKTKELPKTPESSEPEEDLPKEQPLQKSPAVFAGVKTPIDKKKSKKEKKTKRKAVRGKNIKIIKPSFIVPLKRTAPDKEEKIADRSSKEEQWLESEGQLTIDVYQTNGEIVIQSAIAGIEPEDLDISIENDVIIIRGSRKKLFEEEKKNYFYQECYWGRFSREIILPAETDNSGAKAEMKNGILTIRIPKTEREKKKKINVIDDND